AESWCPRVAILADDAWHRDRHDCWIWAADKNKHAVDDGCARTDAGCLCRTEPFCAAVFCSSMAGALAVAADWPDDRADDRRDRCFRYSRSSVSAGVEFGQGRFDPSPWFVVHGFNGRTCYWPADWWRI